MSVLIIHNKDVIFLVNCYYYGLYLSTTEVTELRTRSVTYNNVYECRTNVMYCDVHLWNFREAPNGTRSLNYHEEGPPPLGQVIEALVLPKPSLPACPAAWAAC
jgi:hypothetical protein